jgi:hypothetical protein
MTGKRWAVGFAVAAVGIAAPLYGEAGNKKLIGITTTQQVPFQAGGVIHLNRSYGQLSVEGWDRPEVEITVTRTPNQLYGAKDQADAAKLAENVKVTAERKSDTELEISTTVAHFSRWRHPFGPLGEVAMDYRIRVPRNSKLVIHHENGEVLVSGVTADIEATGNAGDIVLLLQKTGKYSIDAKSKFGTLTSDFDGDFRHTLAGNGYTQTAPAPATRIYLRMGRGGIQIKGSPAQAQPPASGGLQVGHASACPDKRVGLNRRPCS